MAGINIPGVTDQYKTNDTIEKLMKVERIPLTREQSQLDELKAQKDAWRDINSQLSSLREKTKGLYSFENPFNNKITDSTQAGAITAEATRSAEIQSFKIDVIQPATADRFMSDEMDKEFKVPSGTYTYKVGEKQLNLNWKGGSLKDFSNAINRRSNGIVKSMIIGGSSGKSSLMIESLSTGRENRLEFIGNAKDFALSSGMIEPAKSEKSAFGEDATLLPENSMDIEIPKELLNLKNTHITFSLIATDTDDVAEAFNKTIPGIPSLHSSGSAEFGGITITNSDSDSASSEKLPSPKEKVQTEEVVYAVMADGSEKLIETPGLLTEDSAVDIALKDYSGITSIRIKNANTGKQLDISAASSYDGGKSLGYQPKNPVSEADDAILKYEGIQITRAKNDIDDIVPEITLHVHDKTDKAATISIKPDKEASKDALIQFVGQYNRTVAELNILSQNKEEIISELDYLTSDERETEMKKLGMFVTDFTLPTIKSNMAAIITAGYQTSDQAVITMLSQIGISTNASGGNGSYSQSRLRGYLEIDEKKLDQAIENHLDDIKMLFGYDSDGDLVSDRGIGVQLDKQIAAYTQTGGILAMKTSGLDSKIKASEQRIARLETQMDRKEAELRNKYGQMEGALNSLEGQQNSISNFTNQQNRNR